MVSTDYLNVISARLTTPPSSILAVGLHDAHWTADKSLPTKTVQINSSLEPLDDLGRYDVAIVAETLEHIDRSLGAALIARLRDVLSRRLYIAIDVTGTTTTHWTVPELSAFGLTIDESSADGSRPWRLFSYEVGQYKLTPDWLTTKGWANPEQWEKTRW
jgi:hypothetical protein